MTGVIVPNAECRGPVFKRSVAVTSIRVVAVAVIACTCPAAGATEAARFTMINRGPLHALIGVPDGWNSNEPDGIELAWDIASHAVGAATAAGPDAEFLVFDGETHALTLRLRYTVRPRLSVSLELPWIAQSGGFLDRGIDGWHDAFGLHEGIRPDLPTNDLRYEYRRGNAPGVAVDHATSGVGDLRTGAAFRLGELSAEGVKLDLTAEVKWPTGDVDHLSGSGGTDVAIGARLTDPAAGASRLGWSLGAGVVRPGDADAPLPEPEDAIPYYDASVSWRALESLDLVLQLQGQGATFDSALKMLGEDSLQLGGGFLWRVHPGWEFVFSIFEDISIDTAPDFSAQFGLRWRPRTATGQRLRSSTPGSPST